VSLQFPEGAEQSTVKTLSLAASPKVGIVNFYGNLRII
jgi:hypothetical protein